MENTRIFFLAIAIALAPFPWFLPSIAEADGQGVVNCDLHGDPPQHRDSLQEAINFGFGTIFVTGTCTENNYFIGPQKSNIRLNGKHPDFDGATISSSTPEGTPIQNIRFTVTVSGATDVRIMNFTITGNDTADGVNIVDGANVRLQNSIIENAFREGVFVRAASARIFDNTIQNNGGDGIVVTENSAARIGFSSPDDGIVRPNTIQGNVGNGISVLRSSTARIVGNTSISGNGGHGISVFKASQADIASNEISGNGGDGINVRENSGVNLGSAVAVDPIPAVFTQPNSTTALNSGFGIRCSIGGYANGRLGTLAGASRGRSFDRTCIDSLVTD